jgi:hypothetical protein
MRLIALASLASLLSFQIIAQKHHLKYLPGFIVTLEGDSVKGFIGNGTDAELGIHMMFKETMTDVTDVKYLPESILSFAFDNGRVFRRFSYTKTSGNPDSVDVFAKKNLGGKIDMYTFSKFKRSRPDIFLVNNQSHRTVHLEEPKTITKMAEDGGTRSGESFKHLGLLTIIKGDSLNNSLNVRKVRYDEKSIRNDILNYNERFGKDFTPTIYQPQLDYSYTISAGLPILSPNPLDLGFRIALYRHKHFSERTRTMSLIRGISYRYTSNPTNDNSIREGSQSYRQQYLSFIPIGVHFQTDSRVVRCYVYFSGGVAFLLQSRQYFERYEDAGRSNDVTFFPTFNVGAGVKVKVKERYMVVEITPTGNKSGTCINLGYSF